MSQLYFQNSHEQDQLYYQLSQNFTMSGESFLKFLRFGLQLSVSQFSLITIYNGEMYNVGSLPDFIHTILYANKDQDKIELIYFNSTFLICFLLQ